MIVTDDSVWFGPVLQVYITGGQGATSMTLINSPEQARRFVAYWAEEGVTWLKAYTNISRCLCEWFVYFFIGCAVFF